MEASNIFISYRRRDSTKDARAICEHLRRQFGERTVFMDHLSSDLGDEFVDHLELGLASCRALLVVIGPQWLTITTDGGRRKLDDPQDFVRLEIEAALERDVVVIPLLVDGARMPAEAELPEPLAPLARRNSLTVRSESGWEEDVRLLVRRLDDVVRSASRSGPPGRAEARSARDTWIPRPAPDAAFLRQTRMLRAAWTTGDLRAVRQILTDLAGSERSLGPFSSMSSAPLRLTPEMVRGAEGLVIHDLPREADGSFPVLLAPHVLSRRGGEPEPKGTGAGWIRGTSIVLDGSARFALGSEPKLTLDEFYVLLDPAPSPEDFTRIGLVATSTLRQGPTSTFARMVRELTPYLMRHQPHLYAVEGAYRTIVACGLLRDFPTDHLHCLPPGRLGALVDMSAGVAGEPVAGLDDLLDGEEAAIRRQLDLDWTLDCVVYLIDPLASTSTMPETLALERQCAYAGKPFLDTYVSIIEWFGLLDSNALAGSQRRHHVDPGVSALMNRRAFPYQTIALLAHDDVKQAMEEFVLKYLPFLTRFDKRIGTGGTAERLNLALSRHAAELGDRGLESEPWVQELVPGMRGGNVQIGESVAMGLCDAALCFGDPRPGMNTHLFERTARIGNDRDRLSSQLTLLHDASSASAWALMWIEMGERPAPITLMTAFADLFEVDLVLADPLDVDAAHDSWASIAEQTAWFLASAMGAGRTRTDRPDDPKRVTIACGSAMADVVAAIDGDISTSLNERIRVERERHDDMLAAAIDEFPHLRRRIERMAQRKRLTLRTTKDHSALWNVGPVVVAPMIGNFGVSTEFEAVTNATMLADEFGGSWLPMDSTAFEGTAKHDRTGADLPRHWASTDIVLMTCADLSPELFGGEYKVPSGMYADLKADAVGEVAGLYLGEDGREVASPRFARRGMPFDEIKAVARSHDNRTAIMAVGTDHKMTRVGTTLAALNAGIVSALVTDVRFATEILKRHLEPPRRRAPVISQAPAPHVFISYVRDDAHAVQALAACLTERGIEVWVDRDRLDPGQRWQARIREAIVGGGFFIACFSANYEARERAYMNEELTIAIEELRKRPTDRAWFLPVLLSPCAIPDRGIGAGETLRDIQYVDLGANWDGGLERLLGVIDAGRGAAG